VIDALAAHAVASGGVIDRKRKSWVEDSGKFYGFVMQLESCLMSLRHANVSLAWLEKNVYVSSFKFDRI